MDKLFHSIFTHFCCVSLWQYDGLWIDSCDKSTLIILGSFTAIGALVSVKQPWRIWVSFVVIKPQQSTTKCELCTHVLGYSLPISALYFPLISFYYNYRSNQFTWSSHFTIFSPTPQNCNNAKSSAGNYWFNTLILSWTSWTNDDPVNWCIFSSPGCSY